MIDFFFFIGKMCIAFFLLGDWGGGGECLCVWSHVCWRADLVKPLKKKKKKGRRRSKLEVKYWTKRRLMATGALVILKNKDKTQYPKGRK